jgi:hypothetical protein
MAATPYTAVITVTNAKGQKKMYNFTASDVTTEFWLLPSGGNSGQLSANNAAITDCIISATTGDTTQVQVFINGLNSGYVLYRALNLPTAVGGRQVQQNAIPIPAGAIVRFTQLT